MNVQNEAKLAFMSRSANESFARVAVSGFFMQLDPTVDELTDIKTAVSEAVTNAIVHGYREKNGTVYITMRILAENVAYVKVRDCGCGIEDVKKAMEPLYTTAPEEERAGLGFAVMQSFMDTVRVRSAVGKGTTVVMTKALRTRIDE